MNKLFQKLSVFLLLALMLVTLLSPSALAAKPAAEYDAAYSFTSLQSIYLAEPDLKPAASDEQPQLVTQLQDKLQRELAKSKSFTFPATPEQAQASLLVELKKLEAGELTEPAHINWHKQNNRVTLPTADGKGSTSVDLGVSVPEYVPERRYPLLTIDVCFTLTDKASGKVIYRREQERTEGNTDSPVSCFGKLVRDMCRDLQKLQKKGRI